MTASVRRKAPELFYFEGNGVDGVCEPVNNSLVKQLRIGQLNARLFQAIE